MKQRITYVLSEGTGVDPKSVKVGQDSLNFTNIASASLEQRITVGLSELPEEIHYLLKDCHELHLRWSSLKCYHAQTPLVSRVPSGLHVFYTPRRADQTQLGDVVPGLLDLSLESLDLNDYLVRPPILSERFSASASYQYFRTLPTLQRLRFFIHNIACPFPPSKSCDDSDDQCSERGTCLDETAAMLEIADSLNIDFDVISHAVIMTVYWSADTISSSGLSTWTHIEKRHPGESIEVGVLQVEKPDPDEPEELALGGYLTVIGEDDHPGATMFSFPSRHHPLPSPSEATFTAGFQQPAGLHPKLDLNLSPASQKPPADSCALHAYWTLPSALFIDRYQLSDPLFIASQNLTSLRSLSGEDDLEAPDWVVKKWGSAALLELAHPPSHDGHSGDWTVTIPTHLRYLPPSKDAKTPGYEDLEVPWPVVFWACEAQEGLKMATNPFDRVNLGYDGLFGPKTMFHHVSPAPADGLVIEKLVVPVMDVQRAQWLETGTVLAVLAGFGWVCWQLLRTSGVMRERGHNARQKTD